MLYHQRDGVCVCVKYVMLSVLPLQVTFEQDVVITQMNEYEVLQLLMGECRERLAAYKTTLEEETKLLQVSGPSVIGYGFCL